MIISTNFGKHLGGIPHDEALARFKKYSHANDIMIIENVDLKTRKQCQKSLQKITYTKPSHKCDKILTTIKPVKSTDTSKLDKDGCPIYKFPAAIEYATSKSANYYNIINYDSSESILGYDRHPYVAMPIIQYAEDIILTVSENDHPTYLVVLKDRASVIKTFTGKKKKCLNPIAHNKFIFPPTYIAQNQLCYAFYSLPKNTMVYISNRLYFYTVNTDRVLETREKIIWPCTMTTSIICCTCPNLFVDERRCVYCNFIIFNNMADHVKNHKICLFCNKDAIPLNEHYMVYHSDKKIYLESASTSNTVIECQPKSAATCEISSSDSDDSENYDAIQNTAANQIETRNATDFLEDMYKTPTPAEKPMETRVVEYIDLENDEPLDMSMSIPKKESSPTPTKWLAPKPTHKDSEKSRKKSHKIKPRKSPSPVPREEFHMMSPSESDDDPLPLPPVRFTSPESSPNARMGVGIGSKNVSNILFLKILLIFF